MPEQPVIAVFAHNSALRGYLSDLVVFAGGKPVFGPDSTQDAAVYVAGGQADLASIPQGTDKTIVCLGGATKERNVRALETPARAGILIVAIKKILDAQSAPPAKLEIAGHIVDTRESLWFAEGAAPIRLTEKEVAILALMQESAPFMVSRQRLLEKVWAYVDGVETHTLETHIYRLRQKIETDPSNPKILLTAEDGYRLGT